MLTVTPEVVMASEAPALMSEPDEFDNAVWGEEQTGSAQTLGESDLVEVEGEWGIVNSLVKDPFGSGDLILDYRTPPRRVRFLHPEPRPATEHPPRPQRSRHRSVRQDPRGDLKP